MALQAGIVGLPNVGKSTLFNALTAAGAESANYPFCTIEPNVGVVSVPDERLNKLSEINASEKTVPTSLEFVDIAGLVKGASKGEGLGNQFLANIRECDAIVHMVRCFENDDVIHVRRGCLVENLSFAGGVVGSGVEIGCDRAGAVAFPPTQTDIDAGISVRARSGFTGLGPADEGSSGRWRSPYIRNCTNFMTGSIGMKINGHGCMNTCKSKIV